MRRTGNPFVDMGLGTIAALSGKDSIEEVTKEDMVVVLKKYDIVSINKELKSFTMVFGTNGPLYQHAYKGYNKEIYNDLLVLLLDEAKHMVGENICEICGEKHNFDIDHIWKTVVQKYGFKVNEKKVIGRDFFPLIGSLGNDAQALPCASRTINICPMCLFSVNFLPLGTMLINGRLTCIESTSEFIMIELIREIVKENITRISAGKSEIYGKKEGKSEIYKRLLSIFTRLQNIKKYEKLPNTTAIYLWLFSNSGQNADCDMIEIPNKALKFIWEAARKSTSFKNEFLNLINADKNGVLFDCITQGSDYFGLYPKGKFKGVSYELFEFYQTIVVGRNVNSLNFAKVVANSMISNADEKEIKLLKKSDIFANIKNINLARKTIVDLVYHGLADYNDYIELFNAREKYLSIDNEGYKIIMYYLINIDTPKIEMEESIVEIEVKSRRTDLKVKIFAELYFYYYVSDTEKGLGRGIERFKKEILNKIKDYKETWLQDNFAKLAEIYECDTLSLDYDGWMDFVTDEEGNNRIYELLFQLRLAFARLYYEYKNKGGD